MTPFRASLLGFALLSLAGCASMRATTSLEADPEAERKLAGLSFRIAAVEQQGKAGALAPDTLQASLRQHYPALFGDDPEAIPLVVKITATPENGVLPMLLVMILSGTTIPFPGYEGMHRQVEVTPWGTAGALAPAASVDYSRRDHLWITALSPLAMIPIPGRSDIPRRTSTLFTISGDQAYYDRQKGLTEDSQRKAVLTALARLDIAALRQFHASQSALPRFDTDIDGKRYTVRLAPGFSRDLRQPGGADQYVVTLRNVRNEGGQTITTTHTVTVATRDEGGAWRVHRSYLPFASRPTVVTALLESGQPARAVVMPVEQPPLADFLVAPETRPESAAPVRWSNGILLQIKNTSLAAELAGKSLPELQQLLTQLEGALLELNERVGRANDRAQQAMEKGETPDALRELAVVYRQRGEILKAILVQVRQETAARGAP